MARSRQRARPGELRNKMQGSRNQTRSGGLITSLGGLPVFYLEDFAAGSNGHCSNVGHL